MSTTVFNFQVVGRFDHDEMHETNRTLGNEGVKIDRPEMGSYGIYRATFDVNLPGPGIIDGTLRTYAEWVAFHRTHQGAYDIWLWKEPLVEFLYKVLTTDTDGQIGTGDNSETDFSLAHRFVDESTLKVYVNSVLQTVTTHYTIQGNNGDAPYIQFVTAPSSGLGVTVEYEFYYPVQFVSDPLIGRWRRGGTNFRTRVSIEEEHAGAHRV